MGSRVLFQSLAVQNIEGGAGKGKKPALLKSLPQCRLFEDHMERRKSVLNGESGGMKMDNIRIRQADMDDLDGVTLVEARCFPPAEAAGREVFEKRLGTFPESFFIAEDQGKLIGFINGCALMKRPYGMRCSRTAACIRRTELIRASLGWMLFPNTGTGELRRS